MTRTPPEAPSSSAQQGFLGELERLASSPVSVLIRGEHGVGKSRAAGILHRSGERASGPLVVVDLGALAPSLMEAELFGHEEGSFTGAHRSRLGRVRRADGGTLLLDGIEDLAPEAQGKLLRVLQERVVEPLGSSEPVPVDVRIVATAGPGLDEALDRGHFREDLYFRLAVVVVHAPALRARPEDLPGLCDEIQGQIAARAGVAARALGPDSMERLLAHPWPGNVRELENALERVLVLGAESTGSVAPSEFDFLEEGLADADLRLARQILAHGIALDAMDLTLMEEALVQGRGNHSAAARALGLSRKAFNYRLRKLREEGPSDGVQDGEP
ncbi:MAG TPA: sigma-54-dependent Fis family transcriptional regulator [Planctomycetes bacterium]|nr:sigma-54-dependent Fis family transcriptional regulator [Planctomycetota bacterium]HIK60399.1 sigma-54-dependent Fis family transcriptional regulator [Planctomycetota bacterium]